MSWSNSAGARPAAGLLFAVFALSLGSAAYAAGTGAACTERAVETDPAAVIAPCTTLLQKPDLSAAARSQALFIRGQAYHHTKQFQLAQWDYDAALKLTPDNDAIYPSRANIALRLGRFDEAIALLKRSLAINPKNAHALRIVGTILKDMGRLDEAIHYFSMALDADPNEAYALLFRSYAYQLQRRFDLALQDADKLVAMPADEINLRGYLDNHGVKRDFHIKALKNRAEIYSDTGKHDLAERDLTAAVNYKRTADSLEARGAFLMERPGQQQRALDDLQAATALDPHMLQAFYFKGAVLVELKRYQEALAALDRALTIRPDYDYALRMRAITYRALGQADLAARDLQQVVVESPRLASLTIQSLQVAGYLPSGEMPNGLTPQLRDAIHACMLDPTCN
jgi:tetratricopeptide (TPR) repeat protein